MQQVKDKDAQAAKNKEIQAPPSADKTNAENGEAGKSAMDDVISVIAEVTSMPTSAPVPGSVAAPTTTPMMPAHDADHDSGYGSSGSSNNDNGSSNNDNSSTSSSNVTNSEGRSSGNLAADGSDFGFGLLSANRGGNALGEGSVVGLDSPSFHGRTDSGSSSISALSSNGKDGFPNQWLVDMTADAAEGDGFEGGARSCFESLALLDLST